MCGGKHFYFRKAETFAELVKYGLIVFGEAAAVFAILEGIVHKNILYNYLNIKALATKILQSHTIK